MLSKKEISALFDYNPQEGILRWKETHRRVRKGQPAGCECKKEGKPTYIVVRVGNAPGKLYPAHQLIWCLMTGEWPSFLIDHRDLDGTNNKWENLRKATNGQNMMNGRLRSDNKTGVKGVTMHRNGVFRARINVAGKEVFLGRFQTLEEATLARKMAQDRYHGEFARDA